MYGYQIAIMMLQQSEKTLTRVSALARVPLAFSWLTLFTVSPLSTRSNEGNLISYIQHIATYQHKSE
jgi:hypothetical protein